MNLEKYDYKTNDAYFDFEFDSVGPKGVIHKIARFSSIGQSVYNFGFGDLNKSTGEISDTVVSNNSDGDKVLATVASIVHDFTAVYMYAAVFIRGTSIARTRWYQMGISRHWTEIDKEFEISGLKGDEWEPFRRGVNYQAFLGRRRISFLFEPFL